MKSAMRSSDAVAKLEDIWGVGEGLLETAAPPASTSPEQWRLVASRLDARLNPGGAGGGRIVVVSSPDRGDGRSTAALELSRALVERLGRRALLVDADPRLAISRQSDQGRAGLASLFKVAPARGLGDLLAGAARQVETVWAVGTPAFQFTCEHGGGFVELLRGTTLLKARYDYVVIDAPALSASADAAVLARGADGVILVVRPGSTRRRSLAHALDAMVDAPLLGCVLVE
jgi:Mrp family chromosome partitioning ATPase